MRFSPFRDPIDGETVLAVVPTPAPTVVAPWARARFVTGRSVSASALARDQKVRAGHLALAGRGLRAGISRGLEAEGSGPRLVVAAGTGVCGSGEDIVLPRPITAEVDELTVRDGAARTRLADLIADQERVQRGDWRQTLGWVSAVSGGEAILVDGDGGKTVLPALVPPGTYLATWDGTDVDKIAVTAGSTWRVSKTAVVKDPPVKVPDSAWVEATSDTELVLVPSSGEPVQLPGIAVAGKYELHTKEAEGDPVARITVAGGTAVVLDEELRPRVIEPTAFTAAGAPFVGVVVLEPVQIEIDTVRDDSCEPDPEAVAFADWRTEDATVLFVRGLDTVLDELGIDAEAWLGRAAGLATEAERNVLAQGWLDLEAARGDAARVWERRGLGLALIAVDGNGVRWLDRAAIARPVLRAGTVGRASDRVEVARIRQFADQAATATDPALSSFARFVPPVGVIGVEGSDLLDRTSVAFPAGWKLTAAPLLASEVDAVIRGARGLAPFDLQAGWDAVRLLVPVRAGDWDRDLLRVDVVDDAFHDALVTDRQQVDTLLAKRAELRVKTQALQVALAGHDTVPPVPALDAGEAELANWDQVWHNVDFVGLVRQTAVTGEATGKRVLARAMAMAVLPTEDDAAVADVLAHSTVVVVAPVPGESSISARHCDGFVLSGKYAFGGDAVDGEHVLFDAGVTWLASAELDADGLDAAVAAAGGAALLVLCTGLTEDGAEELAWRRSRDEPIRVCLVSDTGGVRAETCISDAALALLAVARGHGRWVTSNAVTVLATRSRIVVQYRIRRTSIKSVFKGELAAAKRALAKVHTLAGATRLQILKEQVGLARAGMEPDGSGTSPFTRLRLAMRIADRAEALGTFDAARYAPDDLLALLADAGPGYDVEPTGAGMLSSELLSLSEQLAAMRTGGPTGPTVLSTEELARLPELGVVRFAQWLSTKVDKADDVIDLAYLQVQAATHRVRQYLGGKDAAVRFSASPLLPELADIVMADWNASHVAETLTAIREATIPPDTNWMAFRTTTWDQAGKLGGFQYLAPLLEVHAGTGVGAPEVGTPDTGGGLPEVGSPPTAGAVTLPDLGSMAIGRSVKDVFRDRFALPSLDLAEFELGGATTRLHAGALGIGSFGAVAFTLQQTVQAKATSRVGIEQFVEASKKIRAARPVPWSLRDTGGVRKKTDPIAVELRQHAFHLRASIVQSLAGLDLNLVGVQFPGFLKEPTEDAKTAVFESRELTPDNVTQIVQGKHDLVDTSADADTVYADALRSLEVTAAMLRIVEARMDEVRDAIARCGLAEAALVEDLAEVTAAGSTLDDQLAEARHDASVTASLVEEEAQRVAAVNERRRRVLTEAVGSLVFVRGRAVDLRDPLPVHDLEPALPGSPVLAALSRPIPVVPDELRAAVELWRDSPAQWLVALAPVVHTLDTNDRIRTALLHARERAAVVSTPRKLASRAGDLIAVRRSAVAASRVEVLALQPAAVARLSWLDAIGVARRVLSVADLVASPEAGPAGAARVARELHDLLAVSAGLYQELCTVQAPIRAEWATRLSEFDDPPPLQDLSVLPRWSEVGAGRGSNPADPFRRRELQAYVSWLFDRVDRSVPEAVELMTDLVRICVLLASHAPVGKLLAAHVSEPAPIEVGGRVRLMSTLPLRVGMTSLLRVGGAIVARGVVEDLHDGGAVTRVITALRSGLRVSAGDAVELVEPDAAGLAARLLLR